MSAEQNTAIVKQAYAAFARRDIPALLNLVSDDVDWQGVIGASAAVPTSGRRVGRQAVAQFFDDLARGISFRNFEPREFVAERDKVVVLGFYEPMAVATGRGMASEWVMIFTVAGGRIVRFREFTDVAALNALFA